VRCTIRMMMSGGHQDSAAPERGDGGGGGRVRARPAVSVVIPTFNRRERLLRVLAELSQQTTTAPFEVIVVSDGSDDGTVEALKSFELPIDLRWASQSNQGPATARNRGVEMAEAPIVLFLDDDVVPDPDLVGAHLAAHERSCPHAVVIGPMLDPPDHQMSPWVRWEQRMLSKQYDALVGGRYGPTFRQFYTGNASMPRRDVLDAGGFDTTYRRAEDVELGIRLWDRGASFAFDPEARGYHYAVRSYEAWRAVARAYGQLEVELARHPGREWQWEFLSHVFHSRHLGLRTLLRAALRFPNATEAIVVRSSRPIELLDRSPLAALAQWLLSTIYATDYWRSATAELGGRQELFRLVRRYREPGSGGPVAPSVAAPPVDHGPSGETSTPAAKGTQ
jgi:GT2 family glycosyltransferase